MRGERTEEREERRENTEEGREQEEERRERREGRLTGPPCTSTISLVVCLKLLAESQTQGKTNSNLRQT